MTFSAQRVLKRHGGPNAAGRRWRKPQRKNLVSGQRRCSHIYLAGRVVLESPNQHCGTNLDTDLNMRMAATERRAAVSLAGIYALRMLGLFMILPVFALHASRYDGATAALNGLAIGIYGLTQALLQIPFGMLSDRIGRKKRHLRRAGHLCPGKRHRCPCGQHRRGHRRARLARRWRHRRCGARAHRRPHPGRAPHQGHGHHWRSHRIHLCSGHGLGSYGGGPGGYQRRVLAHCRAGSGRNGGARLAGAGSTPIELSPGHLAGSRAVRANPQRSPAPAV